MFSSVSEGKRAVILVLLHAVIQAGAQVELCRGCFSAGTVGTLPSAMKASRCTGADYCQF